METRKQLQKNEDIELCIQNCLDCHRICLETAAYCLERGGKHSEASHIRLLLDCAQICQTAADFLMGGSDQYGRICGACAEVCTQCAENCEQMRDDERMLACAEICRLCADSCRQMAAPSPMG